MLNLQKGSHTVPNFSFECGDTISELTLVYETYGTLAKDGGNAILMSHGFASHHRAGGDGGWWSGLIGPGRAIDTEKYFVICANMPGSSFGSTGPSSINPVTGKPFGPDFPDISIGDMVEAQRHLIDALGVAQLAAVMGYSYGGYLTFQWAVAHPERMRAIVVAASRMKGGGGPDSVRAIAVNFTSAPGWNGGHHYDQGDSVFEATKTYRANTLRKNGMEQELLAQTDGDADEAARILDERAAAWARQFDPNALIALRRAVSRFDVEDQVSRIKAPLLYVLCSTDNLFPASDGPDAVERFKAQGVDAIFYELDSPHRHRGALVDWAKWAPPLAAFLAGNR